MPAVIRPLNASSEKVIVATPLGPNHAMNAFVARSGAAPHRATNTPTVRATNSVVTTTATAPQPSSNRPWRVSSDPNTTKIPSLTSSTRSAACSWKWWARSGRRMPYVIAHTNTAIRPLPWGGRTVKP